MRQSHRRHRRLGPPTTTREMEGYRCGCEPTYTAHAYHCLGTTRTNPCAQMHRHFYPASTRRLHATSTQRLASELLQLRSRTRHHCRHPNTIQIRSQWNYHIHEATRTACNRPTTTESGDYERRASNHDPTALRDWEDHTHTHGTLLEMVERLAERFSSGHRCDAHYVQPDSDAGGRNVSSSRLHSR